MLVDKTKDLSKNEQMSISIRYLDLDKVEMVERFLTFVVAPQLTPEHLSPCHQWFHKVTTVQQ